ncbi:MAG: nuclear transport factor 2 family protein [Micrococcus sp.]|nr:nuclear transport factor 2 family protein [Micrococcus sp.]
MGQARELMRRITDAVVAGDEKTLTECYTEDAVAETPDWGTLQGRSEIVKYLQSFSRAFPDFRFEPLSELEDGNVAIDEGYIVGTHTGPMTSPTGEDIAPTGSRVRMRECDVLVVENGLAVAHRFYFDQQDFNSQLNPEAGTESPA